MAFKITFVPPKKASFHEDPLSPKFFNDDKEEELVHGSFGSTVKARFKGDTVTTKEIIGNRCDETGMLWKKQKYWKVSITLI